MSEQSNKTHFGFQTVDSDDKERLVGDVFRSVASKYDIMNDVMSLGNHRWWKRLAASKSGLKKGDHALDVAAGSGDLSRLFADQVGPTGSVTVTDINPAMLEQGKMRLIDDGYVGNIRYSIENAETLSFDDASFHLVSISFGLRNVTNQDKALESMYRVLKPGGRLLILEFSKPTNPMFEKVYDAYSFNVIPKMGKLIADDAESYQYLVESIRKHPDQLTLKNMMLDAGFDDARVINLMGGIVALHIGYKY